MSQRPVDRERVRAAARFEALREHDLVDIARRDVLLRCAYHLLELVTRDVGRQIDRLPAGARGLRQGAIELPLDKLDLRARKLIERLEVFVAGHARVRDDQDAMPHVVEGEDRVEEHEAGLVLLRLGRLQGHRLEPGRCVVSQIADRSAGEPREARDERRVKARHQLAKRGYEGLVRLGGLTRSVDNRPAAP